MLDLEAIFDPDRDTGTVTAADSDTLDAAGESEPTITASDLPERWREHYDERAAVREYDGGQAREHAEAEALGETKRLWYIELIEHLAAVLAEPDEPADVTDWRVGEMMTEYMDRQLHDRWTLERCAVDIRARIRRVTKKSA